MTLKTALARAFAKVGQAAQLKWTRCEFAVLGQVLTPRVSSARDEQDRKKQIGITGAAGQVGSPGYEK